MVSRLARLTVIASVAALAAIANAATGVAQIEKPARVILLVDSSQGMSTMLTHFRGGLQALIDALPTDTEIGILSMGGQLRVRVAPTIDRVKIEKAASTFASDNGANSFLDALVEADRRFMKPATTMRQVFVVLTTDSDTRDEPNIDDYNKFMNDFRRRRGRAYGVLIRSGVSGITGEFLNNFTRNTDGTFDVLAVPNSVPDKMKAIGARISAGG